MKTFTLTQDQIAAITELRMTTIAGNQQPIAKSEEMMVSQVVEYGIRALLQQRKQYQRQRQALRAFAGR